MRSEASLARLAEMGIDVYVPRPDYGKERPAESSSGSVPIRPSIALVATAMSSGESRLLADIGRALRFARVDVESGDASATGSFYAARPRAACIVFATAETTQGGAAGGGRASDHEPTLAPPLSTLLADAAAKRRFWRALRDRIGLLHGASDDAHEAINPARATSASVTSR